MRPLHLALLVSLASSVTAAADRPLRPSPTCKNPGAELAAGTPRAGIHPLGQEPPAKQVLTVMRSVDGCVRPVIVREKVGPPRSR